MSVLRGWEGRECFWTPSMRQPVVSRVNHRSCVVSPPPFSLSLSPLSPNPNTHITSPNNTGHTAYMKHAPRALGGDARQEGLAAAVDEVVEGVHLWFVVGERGGEGDYGWVWVCEREGS